MRLRVCAIAALLVATGACTSSGAGGDASLPVSQPPPRKGPDLSDATLWLSFEQDSIDFDGTTVYPDALDGPFDGRVVVAGGGSVEVVPGSSGSAQAVAFPPKCVAPTGCPRALVEVSHDPTLDPGDSEFEYGASVWLAPDQTTRGSNIVQKGRFASDGGLWKLQVDSDAGHPSCVMRSGTDLIRIRSRVSISDSTWHLVVCRRDRDRISISVDGSLDTREGSIGPVTSTWPVRIGAPGVGEDDDQFHGHVDDVYLRIGKGR
jgi:Concanavalin A-like lectin/glucanases superfamily